jgi:hypothetical protein
MTTRDGLYLAGVWVAPSTGIATTHQGNDLSKPATLQLSYSTTFQLPDNLAIRELTANAEQLDSGSPDPYTLIKARLVAYGEELFVGLARLSNFSNGWEVELVEEGKDLYTRLDRSIRTANLSQWDHPWTLDSINAMVDAITGTIYPLIDYGLLQNGEIPLDVIFPGFYLHTLVKQLLYEEGYSLTGDLEDDPRYKNAVIPFVEEEPTNQDEEWQTMRQARVTQDNPDESVDRGGFSSSNFMDRTQPHNIDNRPLEGFSQGELHNYNTQTYEYICDSPMRLTVNSYQQFKVRNVSGSVEFILSVEKNGQTVASEYMSTPGGYNIMGAQVDSLTLNETIICKKGDRVRTHFIARRRTAIGNFKITVFNGPDTSWTAYTPERTTATGDIWKTARNLPDLKAKDLLISIAYMFSGNWQIDPLRREIKFVSLTGIIKNTANAVDWSDRVDNSTMPGWTARIDPYAQNNLLKWKEDEDSQKAGRVVVGEYGEKVTYGYGDGNITINANTLDQEVTLFEMPFAASILSTEGVPGYGNPVSIRTRSVTGSGDSLSINNNTASPRLVLVSSDVQEVKSKRLLDDGITSEVVTVKLRACWFAQRPFIVNGGKTAYSLAFSAVKGTISEEDLIHGYYEGLQEVLRRMRLFNVPMLLSPADISTLDFGLPVRIRNKRVGRLYLSDQFFYLNKIADYQPGRPCMVTLICF